jgi:hypothetical protein
MIAQSIEVQGAAAIFGKILEPYFGNQMLSYIVPF